MCHNAIVNIKSMHVNSIHVKQQQQDLRRCIGPKWPTTEMANGGLLRPVMSPGLKSPPWSTHSIQTNV